MPHSAFSDQSIPLQPWRLRNGGQPHEMWFWINVVLVLLYLWRFVFLKVYTTWKRLRKKGPLKRCFIILQKFSPSAADWTCCLGMLSSCSPLQLPQPTWLCRLRAWNYSIPHGWAFHRPLSLSSWVVEYRLVVPYLLQKPYFYEFSLLCSMKDVKSLNTLFQIVRPYTEEAGSFVDIAFLFLFL